MWLCGVLTSWAITVVFATGAIAVLTHGVIVIPSFKIANLKVAFAICFMNLGQQGSESFKSVSPCSIYHFFVDSSNRLTSSAFLYGQFWHTLSQDHIANLGFPENTWSENELKLYIVTWYVAF
jgi:hypothetical protein